MKLKLTQYLALLGQPSIILILILPHLTKAQNDTSVIRKQYDTEVIRYRQFRYTKDEINYPRINLKNEFEASHQGKQMFKLHASDQLKSISSLSLGIFSLAGSIYVGTRNHPTLSRILEASFYIGAGFSIFFTIRASKRLNYAVWLRNRDILLQN